MTERTRAELLKRFFRTPKGLLIVVLWLLTAVAASGAGLQLVWPGVIAAVGTAILVDAPLLRLRKSRWIFPDGAMLTGLIVAMILSPYEHWWVAAITGGVAVLSKYVLRVGPVNVFNPAALALVASALCFDSEQSWWGALPEIPLVALVVLFATGLFITLKVNKLPVVLAYLGAWYLLVTIAAFAGDPAHVAELYRAPDLHAALFFAFFMVTDPPTSPPRHRDQLIFAAIVAAAGFAVYELTGGVYFMLAGLLVGNVWEAWRRARVRSQRTRSP